MLIQKFVAESKGKDIRAFVVGDRVVAAMRRMAQGQEFRSNVHRGGVAKAIDLPEAYRETAVRSAQILGLRVAGVDMLESDEGPQVMEVNSSPGLEGIETCTKLDIAGAIVEYIAARVDFPEIDVRQRLTVSSGYGVSEIHIPAGSQFDGMTIVATGLRERDINVLTLYRGDKEIPNPRADRTLHAEDRLLCFGKLDAMRGLLAPTDRFSASSGLSPLSRTVSALIGCLVDSVGFFQNMACENSARPPFSSGSRSPGRTSGSLRTGRCDADPGPAESTYWFWQVGDPMFNRVAGRRRGAFAPSG